jgi:23S rRNA (cytosine1962-C5)-methyltransferase
MAFKHVHLKPGKERLIAARHPWIFDGAVDRGRTGDLEPGPVTVRGHDGRVLAVGTWNPRSALAVRVFAFEERPLDERFFAERFAAARELRRAVVPEDTDALRLVNAEGDGLPGLVVDGFAGHLAVQVGTPGLWALSEAWLPALAKAFEPLSAQLKPNQAAANRERMDAPAGPLLGDPPAEVVAREGSLSFVVPLGAGQKTGFYCDQRENRAMVAALSRGARVLDCHAYTGAFGVHCLAAGARAVTCVDTSDEALALAARNADLAGGAGRFAAVRADAGAFLREAGETFDVVVIDPPALARQRRHLDAAARMYKDLFLAGLKRIDPAGGWLLACSCSAAVDRRLFDQIVFAAVKDSGRGAAVVRRTGAGPDHPVSVFHPEGEYLKASLLAVR